VVAQLTAQMCAAAEDQSVRGTAGLTILGLSEHVDKHGALLESGVVPPLLASLKVRPHFVSWIPLWGTRSS
jgi:hypothetical protein